jgi:uncharacterized membrane protein
MTERAERWEQGEPGSGMREAARHTLTELWRRRPHYRHEHPPVRNVNTEFNERLTFGQRVADGFAATMGSWTFIIVQSVILVSWIILNVIAFIHHWDPYPFILLNLALSFQAAYAAPIIMMSQNRQAMKDRIAAEHDFTINLKAEDEVRAILQHLEYQDELILQILTRLDERGARQPAGD